MVFLKVRQAYLLLENTIHSRFLVIYFEYEKIERKIKKIITIILLSCNGQNKSKNSP